MLPGSRDPDIELSTDSHIAHLQEHCQLASEEAKENISCATEFVAPSERPEDRGTRYHENPCWLHGVTMELLHRAPMMAAWQQAMKGLSRSTASMSKNRASRRQVLVYEVRPNRLESIGYQLETAASIHS